MSRITTLLTGMSDAQLKQALVQAQQAYIDLSTGAKGVSFSYTQG
ncbi:TPA: phage head-tail adapter protein, partial [Morganella morganii]|nr:phage head-tail adapter protein [Morganella morganii]